MSTKEVIFLLMALTARTKGFWLPPNEVCYGKYGCFERQPSLNPLAFKLPQSPSEVGTSFHMFTRDGFGIVDDVDESKLAVPRFDISRRTIFVIHGYTESINTWATRMKDALLEREDCNVILVDWSPGAKKLLYPEAAGNTRLVGAQIAELIRFLISTSSGSPDLAKQFYIVGFSLGAQTAGYAGAYLKARGMTLGRITGLDPAGPLFTNVDTKYRLDPGDAAYVDVIHTDARGFGTDKGVGHTDFWPNSGNRQPGCENNLLQLVETFVCDHMRAPEYYIASIQNLCSWKAFPCQSYNDFKAGNCLQCNGKCPTMGYGADETKKTGYYYLRTTSEAPFCGLN